MNILWIVISTRSLLCKGPQKRLCGRGEPRWPRWGGLPAPLPWLTATGLSTSATLGPSAASLRTDVKPALWEFVLAARSWLLRSIVPGGSFMAWKKPCTGQNQRTDILKTWKDLVCRDKNGADIPKIPKNRGVWLQQQGALPLAWQLPSAPPPSLAFAPRKLDSTMFLKGSLS